MNPARLAATISATIGIALLATALVAVAGGPAAPPADAQDGRIVDQRPCHAPFATYDAWLAFVRERRATRRDVFAETAFRASYPQANFERLLDGTIECRALTYRSDGLNVAGFVLQPRGAAGRQLPAIIYNRGGNRDFGRLVFADLVDLAGWAEQGFVVLASQYRGGADSEGRDEFGGADVDDVLNLVPVARSLGSVDMHNVFMAGFSRGGLMTYLAIERGAPVNAAAVIGGPTDLARLAQQRPEMLRLFRELMPDFDRRGEEQLRARRPLGFAARLDKPLLILHGGADDRVPVDHALAIAQQLRQSSRAFELVVYAGDDHSLGNHLADSRRRVVEWFRRHMQ